MFYCVHNADRFEETEQASLPGLPHD
jgi:hypothetical protein